ncbi:MAG: hypothetical protein LBB72_08740 [Spirochaetaceae bacterium]|nr:hypothetical protein [Spirochaetaceae bacterium]
MIFTTGHIHRAARFDSRKTPFTATVIPFTSREMPFTMYFTSNRITCAARFAMRKILCATRFVMRKTQCATIFASRKIQCATRFAGRKTQSAAHFTGNINVFTTEIVFLQKDFSLTGMDFQGNRPILCIHTFTALKRKSAGFLTKVFLNHIGDIICD